MLHLTEYRPRRQPHLRLRLRIRLAAKDSAGKRHPGRKAIQIVADNEHPGDRLVGLPLLIRCLRTPKAKRASKLAPQQLAILLGRGPIVAEPLSSGSTSEAYPDVIGHERQQAVEVALVDRFLKLRAKAAELSISPASIDGWQADGGRDGHSECDGKH